MRPLNRGHFVFPRCELELPSPLRLWRQRRYLEARGETLSLIHISRSARSDMLDVANLRPLLKDKDVLALQRIASDLPIDDQVLDYAVRLARTTRNWPGLALGAGRCV